MSRSERSRHQRRAKTADARAVVSQPVSPEQSGQDRFEVRCACGVVLRGERVAGETSVLCPGCGTELALAAAGTRRAVAPPPPTSATELAASPAATRGPAAASLKGVPEPQPADDQSGVHPERLEQRRRLSALRIMAVVVLLLVVATAYWSWHKRRQQNFLLELQAATSRGEAALEAADFDGAVAFLAEADRAARGLQARDSQARLASQLYREAQIWSKLAVSGIDEFFFDRTDAAAGGPPKRLVDDFDRELAGRSIIIQTRAIRSAVADANEDSPLAPAADSNTPDADTGASQATPSPLALDWMIAGENFRVEVASQDLGGLEGITGATEQELIFGAELRSLERDPRQHGRWLVRLVPQSCVLLTAPGPFAAMNWPDREQLDRLLANQRAQILPAPNAAVQPEDVP